LLGAAVQAAPFSITNVSLSPTQINLSWEWVTNRYILERATNLTAGQFEFLGAVLSTNSAAATNDRGASFYRVRVVRVLSFPDTNFEAAVRDDIPIKYSPTNEMYDIDVERVETLNVSHAAVSNMAGLAEFTALTNLHCGGNALTNLDVSALVNLRALNCRENRLIELDLSTNTNLVDLRCERNALTNLDVSALAGLTALRCYENDLATLDVSACTNLRDLYCQHNCLTGAIDVSVNTNLLTLMCYSNALAEIIVWDTNDLPAIWCDPWVTVRGP
jgi:hypothetical protein